MNRDTPVDTSSYKILISAFLLTINVVSHSPQLHMHHQHVQVQRSSEKTLLNKLFCFIWTTPGFPLNDLRACQTEGGFSLIPLWVLFIYFIFFIFYRQHEYNICAWEDKCSLFAKQQNCRRAALVSLPGVVPLWVVWTERCKQTLVKKFLWDFVSNNSMPQRTKWWVQASYW